MMQDPDTIPVHWFDKGVALRVVRHYFHRAKTVIRIAVGFFTIRGYNLIRGSATGKKLFILVGVNEPGEDRVKRVIVKEIMDDLSTGLDQDRRTAVLELVERMEGGKFRIVDAHAMDHHAKLYVVDSDVALVGSANISGRGLIEAIEAGYTVSDPAHVADYVQWYEDFFNSPNCFDITQALIDALRRWLSLAHPWDIYLKTLNALRYLEDTRLQRATYRKPVGFQTDVIARALRQIEEFNGAMVVASTGLGKTVIATDIALRLKEAGTILNVLIIGPKAVEKSWKAHMLPTGLNNEFFNPSALDARSSKRNRHLKDLEDIFEVIDDRWLIIVDESHEFRKYQQEVWEGGRSKLVVRRAFRRLLPVIRRSKARVLLLTGTPLSTGIDNVNSQLLLLPHTAPQENHSTLPLFGNPVHHHPNAWCVDALSDLKTLPVSSAITTPYVARHYGRQDEENGGTYIDYNGERRYIPQVTLYRINTTLPLEDEIAAILKHGYLITTSRNPMIRTVIERTARVGWGSSPWMLRDVLSKSVKRPGWKKYNVQFKMDVEAHRRANQYTFDLTGATHRRTDRLNEIIAKLEQMQFTDDPKLLLIVDLLAQACAQRKKTVVFSEFWATVAYLETALRALLPQLRVASMIELEKPGQYVVKKDRELEALLLAFAPLANEGTTADSCYNVFLATDAYGVGVNMQDAQVVINYDLAWTAIEPAQRAGRVLRLWHQPRAVELYAFVPTLQSEQTQEAIKMARRWQRLTRRHEQASVLMELPTLTTQAEPEAIDMASLAGPPVVELGALDLEILDLEHDIPVTPVFRHMAQLEGRRDEVRSIPDDISSAMVTSTDRPLVYTLLRSRGKYQWGLYDVRKRELLPKQSDLALLDLIECQETMPTAAIDPVEIDRLGNACVQAWCQANRVEPEEVMRICTLYLAPEKEDEIGNLIG